MLPASIQYCAHWSAKGPKLYNENARRAGRSFTARRAALWSNGASMSALPLSQGRKRTTKCAPKFCLQLTLNTKGRLSCES
jgi:hypothetical protein